MSFTGGTGRGPRVAGGAIGRGRAVVAHPSPHRAVDALPAGQPGGRCGDLPAGIEARSRSVGHLDRIEAVRSTVRRDRTDDRRTGHHAGGPRPRGDRAHHLGGPRGRIEPPLTGRSTRSAPARTSSSPTRSATTSTPRATDVTGSAQRRPNPSPPAAPLPGSSRWRSRARSRSATSAQAPRAAVRSSTSSGVAPFCGPKTRAASASTCGTSASSTTSVLGPVLRPAPTTRRRCGAGPRRRS